MKTPEDTARWRNLLILAFLAIQLGAPLHYYLSDRVYDERFAWRMFSPTRMVRCQVEVTELSADGVREVALEREVIQAWGTWMERGHAHVIEGFGAHYCAEQAAAGRAIDLRAELVCRRPDGSLDRVMDREEDLCR